MSEYIRSEYLTRNLMLNAPELVRIASNERGEIVKLYKPRNYNEWFVVIIYDQESQDMGIVNAIVCERSSDDAHVEFQRVKDEINASEEGE